MTRRRGSRAVSLLLVLGLLAACSSRDDDSSTEAGGGTESGEGAEGAGLIDSADCPDTGTAGIEGDTITLASSFPQSGLTAAFAQISRGYKAYFDKVNDDGGVDVGGKKYKIEVVDKDDEYNSAKTSTNIEELVGPEGDKAFAVFNVVGTANNITIRDFLNDLCVPNVFAATGATAWGNTEQYPWMIGGTNQPYTLEGKVFADYLKEEKPDAKVAMLVQDDDFGASYEEGFRQATEGTDIEVVGVEKYPTGAQDVGSQITSLAATDADAFFNGGTLLACPDALKKAAAAGWEPTTYVSGTCISKTLMGLAGPDAEGVLSTTNIKDPLNPAFADDEAMAEYREVVEEKQPDADVENGIVAYGWTQGALVVAALEAVEGELNRTSFMESVRQLDGVEAGLLIDGFSVTTSADDAFMGEKLQIIQYDAANAYFTDVGEPIDLEGQTKEFTPEELITG